jgi:beta-galactosidase GanA
VLEFFYPNYERKRKMISLEQGKTIEVGMKLVIGPVRRYHGELVHHFVEGDTVTVTSVSGIVTEEDADYFVFYATGPHPDS